MTKITERAVKVAEGTIKANGAKYTIFADTLVGQRVREVQKDRFWLIIKIDKQIIRQSTQKRELYNEWMQLVCENGVAA
jgi:hypothetical protein